MMTKRRWLIMSLMLAICVCIGLCILHFPTATVYASTDTRYAITTSVIPSDIGDKGRGCVSVWINNFEDELTGKKSAKEGDEVEVAISIQTPQWHSLKSLYYTSPTDPSIKVDIDLTTLKFIMPAYEIVVHAEFTETTRYSINIHQTEGGEVYMFDWAYEGQESDFENIPNAGYRIKSCYYIDSTGARHELSKTQVVEFTMPADNIDYYVEFEKIPYTITIPEQVTVKRGEEILTNESNVYIGDELTITYDMPDHYEYTCKIKKDWISSGDTYTVKAEDVDIYFLLEQCEWQVSWQESEKYTISMDSYGGVVANNSWIYWDEDLFFTITSDVSYRVTKVLLNGKVLSPNSEGKYNFLMPQETAVITVEGEDRYMMDWTDEATHTMAVKNGDYVAKSPDWFAKGTTLTISVTPEPGYRVTKILANGVVISTSNQATYVMGEEMVDFTAEVEKIVYSIIIYEWFANYDGTKEFKYVGEQTATVGETVEILHRHNQKFYSCGDIFYCLLDDPRNFDKNTFNEAYEISYSADVWDETDIDFDTMPAENIAVFFELYERSYGVTIPANVTIEVLERFGEELETPNILTNEKGWLNVYDKIKITATQTTEHFITEVYGYNSTLHSEASNGIYLGKERVGMFHELFASVVDKAFELDSGYLPITFKTVDTQFEWMMDWTEEDTHSFTIKNGGGYKAKSPDWFERGTELTITVTPATGYRVIKILANGTVISTSAEATYIMQEKDVEFTAEVEKIAYTITIPDGVTVKRGEDSLTNSDYVYIDDILTITYNSPAHFETVVKVNNITTTSGNTFTVGAEDVVITYESSNQVEWQITFASGTGYTIEVKVNGIPVDSGSWHTENTVFDISIIADMGYAITQAKVNDENLMDTYTMTKADAAISVLAQKVGYTIGKSELNGTFTLSHTTANYNDTITISNIIPNTGWQLKNVYYVLDGIETPVVIKNNEFTMPAGNVTVYIEVEKIAYTITIPDGVTVKRGETVLTNTDKVYIEDELTILYDEPAHFDTTVTVNDNIISSGNVFTVGTENVVIAHESHQNEWQIIWANTEDYVITVKNGSTTITSGTWLVKGVELTIIITPTQPETHEVTKVIINSGVASLINNKYTTIEGNTVVSAVVELKEIKIKDDDDHVIVIDERENVKDAILDIVIVEETAEEYAKIMEKLNALKSEINHKTQELKAYTIRLLKNGEPVILTSTARILLLLPEFYEENETKLYRHTEDGQIEQAYTIQTIGEKRYAVFNTSELGTFAFANFEEIQEESKGLEIGEILGIVAGVVAACVAIAILAIEIHKGKKNKSLRS